MAFQELPAAPHARSNLAISSRYLSMVNPRYMSIIGDLAKGLSAAETPILDTGI
jgi:hypothetical protein